MLEAVIFNHRFIVYVNYKSMFLIYRQQICNEFIWDDIKLLFELLVFKLLLNIMYL